MKRKIKIALAIAGVLFILLNLMVCIGVYIPGIDLLFYFPFAWIGYLARVGPQLHYRWDLICSALVYALVFIAGSHLFLSWLYREIRAATTEVEATQISVWKWRWTLSGFALIVLMFAAGIAVTGVVHQVTWLSRSSEPMYRKGKAYRLGCAANLRQIGYGLFMYASKHDNRFPDDLGTLLKTDDISPDMLICPASKDTAAAGPTTQAVAVEANEPGHCSYIYFGKGRRNDMSSDEPLLLELPSNHDGDGINVCFGDGHVEWFDEPAAGEFLVKYGFERIETKPPYAK